MTDTHETTEDIIAAMRKTKYGDEECQVKWCLTPWADRFDAAHKREITILIDTLAEVVASIEVRFPAIEYALDRKPYLDAKKILEQYKEEATFAATSNQNTQED